MVNKQYPYDIGCPVLDPEPVELWLLHFDSDENVYVSCRFSELHKVEQGYRMKLKRERRMAKPGRLTHVEKVNGELIEVAGTSSQTESAYGAINDFRVQLVEQFQERHDGPDMTDAQGLVWERAIRLVDELASEFTR